MGYIDHLDSLDSSNITPIRVLFFGRSNCNGTLKALTHLQLLGFEVTYVESKAKGEALPENITCWEGDYIFCFRSFFILPKYLIDKAKIAAINFHPAPVEYTGSGCLNFALYDNAKEYGVTAHVMNEKVDNGKIIECRKFPIICRDTVDSLLERTHLKLIDLFLDVVTEIAIKGIDFLEERFEKSKHEVWGGEAKKMVDLEKLKTIPLDIDEIEIEKIVRATFTEKFPPRIFLHGYEFVLKSPNRLKAYGTVNKAS